MSISVDWNEVYRMPIAPCPECGGAMVLQALPDLRPVHYRIVGLTCSHWLTTVPQVDPKQAIYNWENGYRDIMQKQKLKKENISGLLFAATIAVAFIVFILFLVFNQ